VVASGYVHVCSLLMLSIQGVADDRLRADFLQRGCGVVRSRKCEYLMLVRSQATGLGVTHDFARVADRLQVAGDDFVRSFRAGDLDDVVLRRRERHLGDEAASALETNIERGIRGSVSIASIRSYDGPASPLCVSACNKDAVSGVIGVQTRPL
jgi:hypothetical protein